MRLGHPEDVVDGSGCQDLPHGLGDYVGRLGAPHLHGAQEAHDEELVEDGVWWSRRRQGQFSEVKVQKDRSVAH